MRSLRFSPWQRGPNQNDRKRQITVGDDWNAIQLIALSQSNPLKAIAEFVENSIDAHAKTVIITGGREHGGQYFAIRDDGEGVPRTPHGLADFRYVATHICDSINIASKRKVPEAACRASLASAF